MSAAQLEITTYCKCACGNCGEVIEYLANHAGRTVKCPTCKDESILPEPAKLVVMQVCGPPTPEYKNCGTCGTQMQFWTLACPTCEANRKNKILMTWIAICASILGAGAVAGVVVFHRVKVAEVRAREPMAIIPKESRILFEQPEARLPKSTNDLQPGRFYIEKWRGSDLMVAVGDIANVSGNLHRNLRADLDVLDRSGAKIGSVNDYFTELPPHQSWHFVATVTQTNAVSVRFVGIKEERD